MKQSKCEEYYQALLKKDPAYEGTFYVGITTTGVFCRPTCPARKPKYAHCEFFENAKQALLASYRPCKRCRPLSNPNEMPETVRILVQAVEEYPEKRWKDKDFEKLSVNAVQARRLFKRRFGMTFVEYARARRMGIAMKEIKQGNKVIDTQLNAGYESSSGFRDSFSRIMGKAPVNAKDVYLLKATWIDTPLGPMVAISDEEALVLLEFVERRGLEKEVENLRKNLKAAIIPGKTQAIELIEKELKQYFSGSLQHFQTPIKMFGTPFQKRVWKELMNIPSGQTRSYADLAKAIDRPSAFRAVARANGINQLAIIIPCHRVINSNGDLGGYGGGIARKRKLLNIEGIKNDRW